MITDPAPPTEHQSLPSPHCQGLLGFARKTPEIKARRLKPAPKPRKVTGSKGLRPLAGGALLPSSPPFSKL